ncbi:MAG TPA: ABC transporter ATP-binding protein [Leptolyngbyaceae cyanobacterium M33_DOE_097]|uniref:ABC transporter ATP-binding protein n=1 Tax=Oscillatoriales cyanobacterium SpSt-418 TaxID=2282169 RepID=A0A7C3KCD9_9CYAN|nr:ABC transporter ATP-binding protein [Leptolyngbyaceae cyanobacterium M33_DOE_097]
MSPIAVSVQNLGKRFHRFHSNRPRTIMEAALSGWRRLKPTDYFWALRNVSFTVAPGQMLGVLGHNGAGKSTLLQLLGGVGRADEGSIQINGRIGALLDLGASFHADLTGRENVFVSAIAAGLTRREVQRRFGAIVEFAELEPFIDSPLRTYSTGMQMRLAFSIAVHTAPDVLLVDEHLSVGDIAFQTKCLDRIMDLKANGCAIVLISQSAEQICELCDQGLWLNQGQIAALGEPHAVADAYARRMAAKSLPQPNQTYSREIEITGVEILDANHNPTRYISSGEGVTFVITYEVHQPLTDAIFSVSISHEDGQIYFNTHTAIAGLSLPLEIGTGQIILKLGRLDLVSNQYFANIGVFARDWSHTYDYHWHQHAFEVGWTPATGGILHPPQQWEIRQKSSSISV